MSKVLIIIVPVLDFQNALSLIFEIELGVIKDIIDANVI